MADHNENMVGNAVEPRENGDENVDNGIAGTDEEEDECEVEEIIEEEFKSLNDQIVQLNLVLDTLESKNDNIQAELMELLISNREARKYFRESQEIKEAEAEEGEAKS